MSGAPPSPHTPALRFDLRRITDVTPASSAGKACGGDGLTDRLQDFRLPAGSVVVVALSSGSDILRVTDALLRLDLVPAFLAPTVPWQRLQAVVEDLAARAVVRTFLPADLAHLLGAAQTASLGPWAIGIIATDRPRLTEPGEIVLMTSGTSSDFSSGCVHSVEALRRNARRHAAAIGLRSGDRVLIQLPLHYSFAFVAQAIAAMEVGAEIVIGSSPFSTDQFAAELCRHAITATSVTPRLLQRILAEGPSTLAPGLRCLTVGGDVVGADTARSLLRHRPKADSYFTYGISEAGPRVATLAAHDANEAMLGSLGRPLAGTELRIHPIEGEEGGSELLVHSDTLLRRKIGRNACDPTIMLDGRRWLRTGDVVVKGKDGGLFFKGRRSDYIMSSGEKVNLAAIKSLCRAIPGVLEARTRKRVALGTKAAYALEILVDETRGPEAGVDAIWRDLVPHLRRCEHPSAFDITRINPSRYVTVK